MRMIRGLVELSYYTSLDQQHYMDYKKGTTDRLY